MNRYLSRFIQIFIFNSTYRKEFRSKYEGTHFKNGNSLVLFDDNNIEQHIGKIKGLRINFSKNSKNNKILVHKDNLNSFHNCNISIVGNNTIFKFEKTNMIRSLNIMTCGGNNQTLYWGKNSTSFSCDIFLNEENASLKIGEDCMFSSEIKIWCTDGHAIIDKVSKKSLNQLTQPLEIGNHCWIGQGARLLKNTKILENSVVGSGSVVTKSFDVGNVVIAGNPAKIIKTGIEWKRETTHRYEEKQTKN